LIVGDGCTDSTAAVVAGFRDSRFQWFDFPKGPYFGYGNRNIALREARGTYVAFMAHDDLWLPDHLEMLSSCLTKDSVEIAYSRPLWVAPDGTITPSTFNLNHPATLEAFLAGEPHSIPASCVIHRRDCFSKYGYWDERLPAAGDQDMWARIIGGGGRKTFVYLPEPTCLHFRAIWKTERNVDPELNAWKIFHAMNGFTPAGLRVLVPGGKTEQETFWEIIAPAPDRWTQELRDAVHVALDRRVCLSDEVTLRSFGPAISGRMISGRVKVRKLVETLSTLADDLQDCLRWVVWKAASRWRSVRRSLRRRRNSR